MFIFLDHLYRMTNSEDLAGFLDGMAFLNDGITADSAAWSDWLEAVEKAKNDPTFESSKFRIYPPYKQ